MATQELITALFDRWYGQPALVIGGGPSVLTDPQVEPALVISANDHASKQARYSADLWVNMDQQDCLTKLPMVQRMRAPGRIVVNKFAWADYRLGDFPVGLNSGLAAVVVAAALGCNPIYTTGIDCWSTGRAYFHDMKGQKPSPARMSRFMRRDLRRFANEVAGANLRPLSGPLKEIFPPRDDCPVYRATSYRRHMLKQKAVHVRVHREFSLASTDRAPVGAIIALTEREAAHPIAQGFGSR